MYLYIPLQSAKITASGQYPPVPLNDTNSSAWEIAESLVVAEATKRVNQNTVYVGVVSDGARIGDPAEENVALLTFVLMGDTM